MISAIGLFPRDEGDKLKWNVRLMEDATPEVAHEGAVYTREDNPRRHLQSGTPVFVYWPWAEMQK